jgi:predicted permease
MVPIAWLPVLRPHDPGENRLLTTANDCCVYVVGRLAPGVSRDRAEAELQVLSDRFRQTTSQTPRPVALDGTQYLRGRQGASTALAVIGVLSLALVLVLMLACANVGNLVLARAAARAGEIGVRLSLGAGRRRIVRQLLTEGFVLALLASAVGVAVAVWIPDLVVNRLAGQPSPFDIDPDLSVVVYAIALAAMACLTFALAPALHATRAGVMASLKQPTPPRSGLRLRSVLLGIQVAATVVLLTSAGLLLRGVEQARALDLGFAVDRVNVATIELPQGAYDADRASTLYDDLRVGLRDAGIETSGFVMNGPFSESSSWTAVRPATAGPEATQSMEFNRVTPGYFEALGVPLAAGRAFADADTGPVAIVNEAAARRLWNGQDAVGQSLIVGGGPGPRDGGVTLEIVGVITDARIDGLDGVEPLLFMPMRRAGAEELTLLFQSRGASAAAGVASLVKRLEPRAEIEIARLSDRVDRALADLALAPLAASILGIFGLALATVGMFGVFAYMVRQRTREIGIRIALGARSNEVVRLVLAGSSRAVAIGSAVGILGAVGASQILRGSLYGLSPLDPVAYAGVAVLLGAAALAASYVPARRAARIDPVRALRCD